jgi:sarcosine oxidase
VEGWRVTASGTVEVTTTRSRYEAGRLVIAPGAWAAQLFQLPALPLAVEPQTLYWFNPAGGPDAFAADRFPTYIWDLGDGVQFYGFPADDDGRVKVAFFRTRNGDEPSLRAALAARIPSLASGALVATASCKYTLTPDHHFVIGRHPDHDQVVIASPCSGHGYKFATVIGEILADLAIDGNTPHAIDLFSPSRFDG